MLARLLILLPAVGASLRLFGLNRTRSIVMRLPSIPSVSRRLSDKPESQTAQRIARLVTIAANHGPYRATCLRQSLALWYLLSRRGIPADLRIGVRIDSGTLDAHAWVEHAGLDLIDGTSTQRIYNAFESPVLETPQVHR